MTEIEFFNILMDKLNTLPESQLYDIINYYKNYFSNNSISKENLEEILNNLDDPNFLKKILVNKDKTPNTKTTFKTLNQSDLNHTIINSTNTDYKQNISYINPIKSLDINLMLQIGIVILLLIIVLPILTTITAITVSICKLNIKIILTSLNLALGHQLNSKILDLLPEFIFNFPKPSLFLFAIGTSLLSLLFLFFVWYTIKTIYFIIKNIFSNLNKHTDMEDL